MKLSSILPLLSGLALVSAEAAPAAEANAADAQNTVDVLLYSDKACKKLSPISSVSLPLTRQTKCFVCENGEGPDSLDFRSFKITAAPGKSATLFHYLTAFSDPNCFSQSEAYTASIQRSYIGTCFDTSKTMSSNATALRVEVSVP